MQMCRFYLKHQRTILPIAELETFNAANSATVCIDTLTALVMSNPILEVSRETAVLSWTYRKEFQEDE